jgi:hypothetical protein
MCCVALHHKKIPHSSVAGKDTERENTQVIFHLLNVNLFSANYLVLELIYVITRTLTGQRLLKYRERQERITPMYLRRIRTVDGKRMEQVDNIS